MGRRRVAVSTTVQRWRCARFLADRPWDDQSGMRNGNGIEFLEWLSWNRIEMNYCGFMNKEFVDKKIARLALSFQPN